MSFKKILTWESIHETDMDVQSSPSKPKMQAKEVAHGIQVSELCVFLMHELEQGDSIG